MQEIINNIQLGLSTFNTIIRNIIFYITIDTVLIFQKNIFDVYQSKFIKNFHLKLKACLLEKCNSLNLCDFEDSKVYDMIQRSEEDGINNTVNFIDNFITLLRVSINLVSYSFILFSFNLALVIPIVIIPIAKYFITKNYNLKEYIIIKNRTNESRKAWYLSYILTREDFFKEIKLNNIGNFFINKYKTLYNKFILQDITLIKKYYVSLTIVSIAEQIVDGAIFIYIIYCGYIKTILIGNVMTYINSLNKVKDSLQSMLDIVAKIKKESLYIDLLYDFFNYNTNDKNGSIKIDSIKTIEIKNLYFKYENSSNYVLNNINLTFESNKMYTILGTNGSGKTTLIKILMGFYPNYEGEIFINGINLKKIDKERYMNLIGTLFQDFSKYEASYYDNIAYGNIDKIDDDEYIKYISEKFSIDKILNKNSDKIDSQIGFWFDNGRQISMGQWQKIATARAFAKNADMYILDEPNASLDVITEREIEDMYMEIFKNKIGIIIAHRFNNLIKKSSNIVLLNNGEVMEQGDHEYLILNCDLYKEMFFNNLDACSL
ncbi:TPA: ABC transporter ATP-binding protein [Clostridioides difficile]|nr:ABC transporter ATP-binding protein [Clostridioides difficile]